MTQARHFLPWDFHMCVAKRGRNLPGRLTHDFELANDGALLEIARKKSALVETGDKGHRILGGKHYVEKKRRVAQAPTGRISRHRSPLRPSICYACGCSCGWSQIGRASVG